MRFSLIVASLISAVGLVSANSIIHENKSSSCAETRFGCPATPAFTSARNNLDTALSLRGGEVQEPTTLQEVEDILMKASAEGKLVVIDFSAVWCGPCKMIAPLYHELSEMSEFSNIVFLKVDVDENPDTAMKFQVSAMPTFLFIKSGQVVDKMMGANPAKLKDL
eukprot:CAMPEP_0204616128 /NCGR_PEP_ID=MMETSP0717-20131115/3447_1 /ASSEMBLY_ACC=CAM_ASM_000666 /TAXON_ID=230516 /ORGANISM="Chaetoceros curvisetus" /LENGTH=164 /DNA_ID=CAMNT_0051629259 /DNA_START=109 /DNA_END=600 /DNA_ORIENTATION=+